MKKKFSIVGFLIAGFIFSIFFCRFLIFAQDNSLKTVTATIRISVCGNGEIEGGEDCEGGDLNGQTCQSLGYGGGVLTCDIACSFDTSGCSPAPTATPTPTGTPTPTSTSTPTSTLTPTPTEVAVTSTPAPAATSTPSTALGASPGPAATSTPAPVPAPAIPVVVAVFDIDGSGRIEIAEVFTVVKSWVEEWKSALIEEIKVSKGEISPEALPTRKIKKCDLNRDRKCNLLDFSVLLYYIGR